MSGYTRYRYSSTRGYRYPVTTSFRGGYQRRGGSVSRALGSARAAKNASKLEYFNCTLTGNSDFTQKAGNFYTDVIAFWPSAGGVEPTTGIAKDQTSPNLYGAIVNDRSFRLRCAQWDEFRIVSMKVKLNVNPPSSGVYTVCSIYDRDADRSEVELDDDKMTDIDSDAPSFREVCESQGSVKTLLNPNRIYPITRSVYARDISEKSTYTDCTVEYNDTVGESPLDSLTFETFPNFNPAIYFCIKTNTTHTDMDLIPFSYTVEYNVIFRNPKSDLQTFITKELDSYKNPQPTPPTPGQNTRTAIIPSADPYIPDLKLKDGKQTNINWWVRLKAMYALKKTKMVKEPSPIKILTETIEEEEKKKDTELMEVEDDPGTA